MYFLGWVRSVTADTEYAAHVYALVTFHVVNRYQQCIVARSKVANVYLEILELGRACTLNNSTNSDTMLGATKDPSDATKNTAAHSACSDRVFDFIFRCTELCIASEIVDLEVDVHGLVATKRSRCHRDDA